RRPLDHSDKPRFGERSKKGPFTSVSMEAFTRDTLQSPSKRAFRPRPWRIDPCFGVKGGAGATPVSIGFAATKPTVLAPAPSWVTPVPPLQVHRVLGNALRIANRPLTRWRFRMSSYIPKQPKRERDQIAIKLDRDVLRKLELYDRFLESS